MQNEQRLLGRFIRGPIPLAWLRKAGTESKSALLMALAIAFLQMVHRKITWMQKSANKLVEIASQ